MSTDNNMPRSRSGSTITIELSELLDRLNNRLAFETQSMERASLEDQIIAVEKLLAYEIKSSI